MRGGVRVYRLARPSASATVATRGESWSQNIKDSTWGGDLTLHAVAVLDNVNVVIINGQDLTDAVKYLTTANGRVSSRQASWCREVLPLLDRCMSG
eukprot:1161185-Pleurochrysis_carterae.AAC.1